MCKLWCEVQLLSDGKKCKEPCPYQFDPEYVKACAYHDQLTELEEASKQESGIQTEITAEQEYKSEPEGQPMIEHAVQRDVSPEIDFWAGKPTSPPFKGFSTPFT